MITRRKRDMGLTTEESITFNDKDENFLELLREHLDPMPNLEGRVKQAMEYAQQVLLQAGYPSSIPEALELTGRPDLKPNLEYAVRIISAANEYRLHVVTDRDATTFMAGWHFGETLRLLMTNIAYEKTVKGGRRPKVTDRQIKDSHTKHRGNITA